ncbi:hypothetical protein QRX88_00780 [Enterococcus gallinarum]|uniref:ABC transporter substrate-binding protein n=1 Tax=Enterococcus gallinarum TaxID=1353 RepID=A0ABD4ZNE7_ENTGA|nr:hypothetical protein [Enterococcus gallinarum]MDL4934245.1 hypothetical protein [Enterococcus gallinarum]
MKNKILKAGLCVGLLMGLSACGNSDSASSDTVRLFVSGDASEGGAYSKMAKRYEEETGIKVEVQTYLMQIWRRKFLKLYSQMMPPMLHGLQGFYQIGETI